MLGVLDHLPHKIFLKDQKGKMVLVNTAVAKAHHLSVDELIGKSDFDFVDAATAEEWRNQELAIIKKGSESYTHTDSNGRRNAYAADSEICFLHSTPESNQIIGCVNQHYRSVEGGLKINLARLIF